MPKGTVSALLLSDRLVEERRTCPQDMAAERTHQLGSGLLTLVKLCLPSPAGTQAATARRHAGMPVVGATVPALHSLGCFDPAKHECPRVQLVHLLSDRLVDDENVPSGHGSGAAHQLGSTSLPHIGHSSVCPRLAGTASGTGVHAPMPVVGATDPALHGLAD